MPQNQIGAVLSLIGVIGVFILILVLAYLVTKYMGKRMGFRGIQGNRMRVLDRLPLGPERELFIVRVVDKVLLLGVTAQKVTRLEELNPADFPEQTRDMPEGNTGFSAVMKSAAESWGVKLKGEKDKRDE